MVVDYFHVFRAVGAFWPFKANAPLLVDTDAVLPLFAMGNGAKRHGELLERTKVALARLPFNGVGLCLSRDTLCLKRTQEPQSFN